jgi:hypothetical protein
MKTTYRRVRLPGIFHSLSFAFCPNQGNWFGPSSVTNLSLLDIVPGNRFEQFGFPASVGSLALLEKPS